LELAVSLVMIESGIERAPGLGAGAVGGIDEEEVEAAIAIVVEEGTAGTEGLQEVMLPTPAACVPKMNPRLRSDIDKAHRRLRGRGGATGCPLAPTRCLEQCHCQQNHGSGQLSARHWTFLGTFSTHRTLHRAPSNHYTRRPSQTPESA